MDEAAEQLDGTDGTRKYARQSPSGREAARIFYARFIASISWRSRP